MNMQEHQNLKTSFIMTALAQALGIPEEHDHCLFQVFKQSAGIGFHADDEPLIQPGSIITTVSIGHCELLTRNNSTSNVHKQLLSGPCLYHAGGFPGDTQALCALSAGG